MNPKLFILVGLTVALGYAADPEQVPGRLLIGYAADAGVPHQACARFASLCSSAEQHRSEEYFLKASGWILTRLVAHKLHRHRLIGHEAHFRANTAG